jgi:hypothetical protein
MGERLTYDLARGFAELMYIVLDSEYQRGERDIESMFRRLKDLSAYSLIHAEILGQSEGVELLALGMFFGMTSERGYSRNQARLKLVSEESLAYQGQAEVIEQQREQRRKTPKSDKSNDTPSQPPLL